MQVYSPDVSLILDAEIPVAPTDPGFSEVPATQISAGDFVDLLSGDFLRSNTRFAFPQWPTAEPFYDTWTPAYENDGFDQDNDGLIDEGTNGLNDFNLPPLAPGPPAPDDDSERETRPPYPYPIRGVKVSLRLIEKTTNQVYQSSVTHSYVPE